MKEVRDVLREPENKHNKAVEFFCIRYFIFLVLFFLLAESIFVVLALKRTLSAR